MKPHQHPFKPQLHTTLVGAGGWEPHVAAQDEIPSVNGNVAETVIVRQIGKEKS